MKEPTVSQITNANAMNAKLTIPTLCITLSVDECHRRSCMSRPLSGVSFLFEVHRRAIA
jgi:hypothetical protein